jgi:diguanylate cyclase (GGDEF)-like protein
VPYLDQTLSVTVSIGVASFPEHGTQVDQLITMVDDALYAAKNSGRNRIVKAGA